MSIRTPTYRVPRQRGMDPTTRRLAMTAVALGSALVAVVGAWSLTGGNHPGVAARAMTENGLPVIEPSAGPLRVKPVDPGGMQLNAAEQDLFGGPGGSGSEQLAPPPETPDPAALNPPAPPPAPAPVAAAPVPAASVPASPAAPQAAPQVAVQAVAPPAVQAVPQPAPQVAPVSPVAAAPMPAATPAPEPATAPVHPASGPVFVQLAALPTEQSAKDEWLLLQHKLGDLLGGRSDALVSATVNGRTWWRVRTGGFVDVAQAKGFCDQVRAKGANCDVAKF